MTYTSIEQVSQLLELGIPPETADMYYKYNEVEDTWFPYIMPDYMDKELIQGMLQLKQYKPCWSAENLYNLIPKSNSGVGKEIYPMIIKDALFDRGYKIKNNHQNIWRFHKKIPTFAQDLKKHRKGTLAYEIQYR